MTLYNNFLLKRGVGLFSGVGLISGDYGTSKSTSISAREVGVTTKTLTLIKRNIYISVLHTASYLYSSGRLSLRYENTDDSRLIRASSNPSSAPASKL